MRPHATVSYLRSAARRVAIDAIDSAPARLQRALAQVEQLKRALASSQQQSTAVQRQVDVLTKANARLKGLAAQREHDVVRSAPRWSNWEPTEFGLSAGPDPLATTILERMLTTRTRFRKGNVLYHVGERFDALYAIRCGSCKTVLLGRDGQEQVAGYHMAGEIIGIDGIASEFHDSQAIALEDMDVCRLPFDGIRNLARLSDHFGHDLRKLISQEGTRARALLLMLGTMRADQRIAFFLRDLSQRYQARGYSSCEFVLRMTRQEIGSYLGVKLETVSRLLSRFQREGLLQVQGRVVKLLDRGAISHLVDCGP